MIVNTFKMVFTTRYSGGRGGRNGFEHELRRLGVQRKNGKPNHPQTEGKVERFQQALKKWLAAQSPGPATLTQLQALLYAFTAHYNTRRPHRSLPHRATPATAYAARPQSRPPQPRRRHPRPGPHRHHRHQRVVSLRNGGKLHHTGIGRTHARTHVLLLVQDLHIRVINAAVGELLRQLTLDPARNYQSTGNPRRFKRNTVTPCRFTVSSVS